MNYSYWELNEWFTNVDYTVVGSGIVGLNCAITLKEKYPNARVIVLEKGLLPQGASTKNAGFACFGSLSEIIHDLKTHTEEEVFNLVKKRWQGLQLLRQTLGDAQIDYKHNYGYELCKNNAFFEMCMAKKEAINTLLKPLFKTPVFTIANNLFHFKNIYKNYIVNTFEGQIDTGKMMIALLQKAQQLGVKILNNCTLKAFTNTGAFVELQTPTITFKTKKLCIATNGFAQQLTAQNCKPARAQVLITDPIKNLAIKGAFHLDEGYYYFRNINNRILLGGGRNLDFKTEETTTFAQTDVIQKKLESLLKNTILPNTKVTIAHRWSGIMGVGAQKKPILKQLDANVFCGIRLGGMGVAIGSLVGKELAELTTNAY